MFSQNQTNLQKAYPSYVNFLCSGLGNPGSLCYFNSLMQTFASSSQWTFFFNKNAHIDPILKEFSMLIKNLREPFSRKSSFSTKTLRNLLQKIGISASTTREEDFHEFYMTLLLRLESLFHQSITIDLSKFSTGRVFPSYLVYNESIECQLCHHITCQINQESFIILDLDHRSLAGALQQYFGPTTLMSTCPHCSRTSNRILKRKLLFFPKSILFFINRRRFATSVSPSLEPFAYPPYVDMTQFSFSKMNNSNNAFDSVEKNDDVMLKMSLGGISEAIQEGKYGFQLTAVISFLGRDNAGHYICYRVHKEPSPPYAKRWICANDNKVTPTTLETVINLNQTALLLNYEIVRDDL
ncbi:hypothetical protein M9Y10_045467 [Tritrichomonas musculus]|uniref:USP domain-containing protein n=1 Tax=Tritrichomonas musculus TaxID=1915356 RepID=A0ABR2JVC4_9EUKA